MKLLLPFLAVCVLFAAGCAPTTGPFAEYVGVSLLEGGAYDFSGWISDQTSTYMSFGPLSAGDAAAAGVPAAEPSATAYRLEVFNLASDGDFESILPPSLPVDWSLSGIPAVVGTAITEIGGGAIDNQSLHFDLFTADTLTFDLNSLADGLATDGAYQIRFDIRPADAAVFGFNYVGDTITDDWTWSAAPADVGNVLQFPDDLGTGYGVFAPGASAQNDFTIENKTQEAFLDNFRVTRTDLPLAAGFDVLFQDSARTTGLSAVSGWYEFSLYIRRDPAVALNRRDASTILLTGYTTTAEFHDTDVDADWDEWTQISVFIDATDISAPISSSDPVFRLAIELEFGNSGSLLVAAPRLELLPEGPAG